jgi:hypothetical protein
MSRNTLANHRSRHVRASAGRMQQFVGGATVAASEWHGLCAEIARGARYFWRKRSMPVPPSSRDSLPLIMREGGAK